MEVPGSKEGKEKGKQGTELKIGSEKNFVSSKDCYCHFSPPRVTTSDKFIVLLFQSNLVFIGKKEIKS